MRGDIFFVGIVVASTTLLVLNAALPGGLIEGSRGILWAQTITFTSLLIDRLKRV
jgi:Ca2+-transporting ATPase